MAEFTIRSDQIDVEQVMQQIRARIKEKRGVDYTEQEMRELASVKLERFLDPRALRSDLLSHYRRQHAPQPLPALPPPPQNYGFQDTTIYESHRGLLRWVRKLLNPVLKLFFNPNPLIHVLHLQGQANDYVWTAMSSQFDRVSQRFVTRDELDALNYEVLNNLVLELTRLGIEVKNLKMRVESLSTRLDFSERRARALESLVQFKPGAATAPEAGHDPDAAEGEGEGDAGRPGKRRRRRRGRRRGPGDGSPVPPEAGDGAPGAAPGGDEAAGQRSGPRPASGQEPPAPDHGTGQ
jgi:hypothetical protein